MLLEGVLAGSQAAPPNPPSGRTAYLPASLFIAGNFDSEDTLTGPSASDSGGVNIFYIIGVIVVIVVVLKFLGLY